MRPRASSAVKPDIPPAFARMRLDDIGPEDVGRWLDERVAETPAPFLDM